jgi:hypothetical protein
MTSNGIGNNLRVTPDMRSSSPIEAAQQTPFFVIPVTNMNNLGRGVFPRMRLNQINMNLIDAAYGGISLA